MLAQKSKYALRALLVLAKEYGQGPVLISDIAHREAIPHKFLELILLELRNHGILGSKKGKGGGYFLTRAPELVHLGEVLRVLEGSLAMCRGPRRTDVRHPDGHEGRARRDGANSRCDQPGRRAQTGRGRRPGQGSD